MPVKTPRNLNIERNEDTSDDVLKIALAQRWPPRDVAEPPRRACSTWRLGPAGSRPRSGGAFRLIETRDDLAAYLVGPRRRTRR